MALGGIFIPSRSIPWDSKAYYFDRFARKNHHSTKHFQLTNPGDSFFFSWLDFQGIQSLWLYLKFQELHKNSLKMPKIWCSKQRQMDKNIGHFADIKFDVSWQLYLRQYFFVIEIVWNGFVSSFNHTHEIQNNPSVGAFLLLKPTEYFSHSWKQPEIWCLEDYFPFGKAYFQGQFVSFREREGTRISYPINQAYVT